MNQQPGNIVKLGSTVFKVLAWVALGLQAVMGIVLLVIGGQAVPVGGVEVPARLVGVLNLVAAVVYWFMFLLASAVLRLLLDVHCHATKSAAGSTCHTS